MSIYRVKFVRVTTSPDTYEDFHFAESIGTDSYVYSEHGTLVVGGPSRETFFAAGEWLRAIVDRSVVPDVTREAEPKMP